MNLSTARSEKRAKEVDIRKAIGSVKGQLIGQFWSEPFLIVGISTIMSLLLVWVILPQFNEVADKKMVVPWANPVFWMFVLLKKEILPEQLDNRFTHIVEKYMGEEALPDKRFFRVLKQLYWIRLSL